MRVMYWPNEPPQLYPKSMQTGGRAAFQAMAANGLIKGLEIYSYRVARAHHADRTSFERDALNAIQNFQPHILFVQHVAGTDISEQFWQSLRDVTHDVTVVYHEDDPFDPWVKRVDQATSFALKFADLVFASGRGALTKLLSRYTHAPIAYLPTCFDSGRFAKHDPTVAVKTTNVAMIGNRGVRRRLKFLYLPGGRRRADFAVRLCKEFGRDFVLYGKGWSRLASSHGPLPFAEQERAIQAARISANWDHFDHIEAYFSNRLPISLAAGVPHVTTWHEGFDELFADCPGLYLCRSVAEAVDTSRWLAGRPDRMLQEEGLAAKQWALANLEAGVVYQSGFMQALAFHRQRTAP